LKTLVFDVTLLREKLVSRTRMSGQSIKLQLVFLKCSNKLSFSILEIEKKGIKKPLIIFSNISLHEMLN